VKILINTNEFTRTSEILTGTCAGTELERARDMLFNNEASLNWTLKGEQNKRVDGGVEQYLGLLIVGTARMTCLRCLNVVDVPIEAQRQFRLAKDEAHAAKLDQDDELVDAVVSSARFDIAELIEDEFIMTLPFAPKHEACDAPSYLAEAAQAEPEPIDPRPNPFRVLAQLKKPNP
jgi:uncharacterized protein